DPSIPRTSRSFGARTELFPPLRARLEILNDYNSWPPTPRAAPKSEIRTECPVARLTPARTQGRWDVTSPGQRSTSDEHAREFPGRLLARPARPFGQVRHPHGPGGGEGPGRAHGRPLVPRRQDPAQQPGSVRPAPPGPPGQRPQRRGGRPTGGSGASPTTWASRVRRWRRSSRLPKRGPAPVRRRRRPRRPSPADRVGRLRRIGLARHPAQVAASTHSATHNRWWRTCPPSACVTSIKLPSLEKP